MKVSYGLLLLYISIFLIQPCKASSDLSNLATTFFQLKKRAPAGPPAPTVMPAPSDLLNDFRRYITTNIYFHAGDLYEHSVWTSNAIALLWEMAEKLKSTFPVKPQVGTPQYDQYSKLLKEGAIWVQGLDEKKDKIVSIFAGLIHDVGKGGDLSSGIPGIDQYIYNPILGPDGKILYIPYYAKQRHPITGFNYLIGTAKYKTDPIATYDFKKYYDSLGLSDEDRSLIAVVAGMHWNFGGLILRPFSEKNIATSTNKAVEEKLFHDYLNQLRCHAIRANYKNGQIDSRLLRMSILIAAADNLGVIPVKISKNIFNIITPKIPDAIAQLALLPPSFNQHKNINLAQCEIPDKLDSNCKKSISYFKHHYDTYGEYFREALLKYYEKNKTALKTPLDKSCVISVQ